ncbi:MAG: hypothetical protein MZV63_69090 [Marinilabiliales bacterium]|nr:hypothetical protein [Marinilabiliales bacterium]
MQAYSPDHAHMNEAGSVTASLTSSALLKSGIVPEVKDFIRLVCSPSVRERQGAVCG